MTNRSLWAAQATENDSDLRHCVPWSVLEKLQPGGHGPGRDSPRVVMVLVNLNVPYSWPMTLCLRPFALENSLDQTVDAPANRTDSVGVSLEKSHPTYRSHRTEDESREREMLHVSDDSQGRETFRDGSELASQGVPRGVFELQAGVGDGAVPRSEPVLPALAGLGPSAFPGPEPVVLHGRQRARPAPPSLASHGPRLGTALQIGLPASPASAVPRQRLRVLPQRLQAGGVLVPAETPTPAVAPARVQGAS